MFWTQGLNYYIPMAVSTVIFIPALALICRYFKNKPYEKKLLPVRCVFFALVILEVVKIFLLIGDNGLFKPLRFPVVFCSLVMYAYPLFCFKNNRLSELGKAFAILPAFVAGAIFFINPSTLSTSSALYVFITCHSFIFHYAMVCIAVYMIAVKIYDFGFKNFYSTFLALAGYVVFAVALSLFIGGDISLFGPDSSYLGFIYDLAGYIPGNMLVCVLMFGLSVGLYALIMVCVKAHGKRKTAAAAAAAEPPRTNDK